MLNTQTELESFGALAGDALIEGFCMVRTALCAIGLSAGMS